MQVSTAGRSGTRWALKRWRCRCSVRHAAASGTKHTANKLARAQREASHSVHRHERGRRLQNLCCTVLSSGTALRGWLACSRTSVLKDSKISQLGWWMVTCSGGEGGRGHRFQDPGHRF